MKLSRTVTYALQATLQLAQHAGEKPIPCSRLAQQGKMPERFLLQILRTLVNHGILTSTRGMEGGYSLNRPASDISLLEMIEALDGPITTTVPSTDPAGEMSQRRLQSALAGVTADVRRNLEAIKLAQLLPGPTR
jgi:Rrf2 family protein